MLLLLVMLLAVLLLLSTILHLLLLARIPARHRVRSRVMRLPVLRMLRLVLLAVVESRHLRRAVPTAAAWPQIDVDPALVLLGVVLQSQLLAYLLDFGLDLLHVPDAVVSLAHNDVQMPLPRLLRVTDPFLEDFLGFFDELAVQVDRVRIDAADGVVFPKDVLGGLFVEFVGFGGVGLGLEGEVVGGAAVAALVGLLGARGEGLVLGLFVAGGVAEAVVFAFGVVGGGVVEGWMTIVGFGWFFWFYWVWLVGGLDLPLPPRRVEGDMMGLNECCLG